MTSRQRFPGVLEECAPPDASGGDGWWAGECREGPPPEREAGASVVIGFLRGEGIGPEVTDAAAVVLGAVEDRFGQAFDRRVGGAIGLDSERDGGGPLSREVIAWSAGVFAEGGAVLAGPGGGRFVYDLRREFDLFCKINPIRPIAELDDVRRIRPEGVRGVDILVLRENAGGLYMGEAREEEDEGGRVVEHTFRYAASDVRRFLRVAVALAGRRRGRLAIVKKDGGLPELTRLWREIAVEEADGTGVEVAFLDVDFACYRMVQDAGFFDVVAAPNCFGDIVSDMGGMLMGGRGLTFGASYASSGEAFYQTNHGAAYDLAGTDTANPLGHILAMAMMLRQSFRMDDAADAVESAVRRVLGRGERTADLAAGGSRVVSTREMADLVAAEVGRGQLATAAG